MKTRYLKTILYSFFYTVVLLVFTTCESDNESFKEDMDNTSAREGWVRMADMHRVKILHGSCLYNNRIYVFGGAIIGNYDIATVEVYDIHTNTWTTLKNMPRPIDAPNIFLANNRIYITGGSSVEPPTSKWLKLNFEYDPETDKYFNKADSPLPTGCLPACAMNNKNYLFGNHDNYDIIFSMTQKNTFVYDPATDSWDTLPDMTYAHIHGCAVSLGGKIYLIGGAYQRFIWGGDFRVEGKSEMFDPKINSYVPIEDMPVPAAGGASASYKDKILVFGGDTSSSYANGSWKGTNLVQEYDPATDTWRIMKGMPFDRFGSTAHIAGNYMNLVGGEDRRYIELNEVWRFDLNCLELLSNNE